MANESNYSWAKIKNTFSSRMQARVKNNLGVIARDEEDSNVFRNKDLDRLDAYYENRQYDHLPDWDRSCEDNGDHVSVRKRKPRLKVAFAKTLAQRLTAKLVGQSVFPKFTIEDSPEDTEFIKAIIREADLKTFLTEPVRRMINTGSVFVRYWLESGVIKSEWYHSKYCYPVFKPNDELESVVIKYVYTDKNEKDENGNYKRKWFKIELNSYSEILFDNPEYKPDSEPEFVEVSRVEHNLGFVQGEWLKIGDGSGEKKTPDGYGLTCDITDFIDELCYSLSQSSQAVAYNQDPQLTIKGIDQEELDTLVRSVMKSWNLGRQGEAKFLETNLSGVERAIELRDKVRLNIQDITRIVLLDPEKIVGSAQSAKAMEVMHGALKDLVDELRPVLEKILKRLVAKMAMTILSANAQDMDVPFEIPEGYFPTSMNMEVTWPPIFQQTMEDLQKKVSVAVQAKNAGLISPRTALKYIQKDFDIEDIETELKEISDAQAAQAALNPFGGF